ncbi:MAG TPA: ligase-associated DNA damage response exonuclease [Myxococcales bacterium]
MLEETPHGLYCAEGAFHVDPSGAVNRAVVTHAHGDHARPGASSYLCTPDTAALIRRRIGEGPVIQELAYGEQLRLGSARISFHPAGHMLGSAQLRIESASGVWVVSGDYKREPDPTCATFEPLRCDTFVTESTYALPIFRWDPPQSVAAEILRYWQGNPDRASLLFCYALGKAQRILAELARLTDRPVYVHGAVEAFAEIYRARGVTMAKTIAVGDSRGLAGELVLAPLTARGTPWMKRFKTPDQAFASGHLRIRGTRRRRGFDRGFVISDHADWPQVLRTVRETSASRVLALHGHRDALIRYLREQGTDAGPIGSAHAELDPEGD